MATGTHFHVLSISISWPEAGLSGAELTASLLQMFVEDVLPSAHIVALDKSPDMQQLHDFLAAAKESTVILLLYSGLADERDGSWQLGGGHEPLTFGALVRMWRPLRKAGQRLAVVIDAPGSLHWVHALRSLPQPERESLSMCVQACGSAAATDAHVPGAFLTEFMRQNSSLRDATPADASLLPCFHSTWDSSSLADVGSPLRFIAAEDMQLGSLPSRAPSQPLGDAPQPQPQQQGGSSSQGQPQAARVDSEFYRRLYQLLDTEMRRQHRAARARFHVDGQVDVCTPDAPRSETDSDWSGPTVACHHAAEGDEPGPAHGGSPRQRVSSPAVSEGGGLVVDNVAQAMQGLSCRVASVSSGGTGPPAAGPGSRLSRMSSRADHVAVGGDGLGAGAAGALAGSVSGFGLRETLSTDLEPGLSPRTSARQSDSMLTNPLLRKVLVGDTISEGPSPVSSPTVGRPRRFEVAGDDSSGFLFADDEERYAELKALREGFASHYFDTEAPTTELQPL